MFSPFVRRGVRSFLSALRLFVVLTLIIEFVMPPQLILQAHEKSQAEEAKANEFFETKKALAEALSDPAIDFLEKAEVPNEGPVEANDPSIDQNPFFLRSQSWVNHTSTFKPGEDFAFSSDGRQLSIAWKGAAKALQITAPLVPVSVTADYLILAAHKDSPLFNRETQGLEKDEALGEGIFFIPLLDFFRAAAKQERTPVLFFPLPGEGWTSGMTAVEIPEANRIGLRSTADEFLAVDVEHFHVVHTVGKMNFTMAFGMGLRQSVLEKLGNANPGWRKSAQTHIQQARDSASGMRSVQAMVAPVYDALDMANVLPPTGSTAAFGTLFTGYNFENPEQSLFQLGSRGAFNDAKKNLQAFLVDLFWIREAHAAEDGVVQILGEVFVRLGPKIAWVIGTIGGGTLMASILQTYFQPSMRKHFKERNDTANEKGARAIARQQLKNVADMMATNLTWLKTIPYVAVQTLFRFFIDRFTPGSTLRSKHSWFGRLFDKSFTAYKKRSMGQVVNWRSMLEGVIVLGGIDTFLAIVCMAFINVSIWTGIASFFPNSAFSAHVSTTLAISNVGFMLFLTEEAFRNFIAWCAGGTNSRAQEFAEQGEEVARPIARRLTATQNFPNEPARKRAEEAIVKRLRDLFVEMQGGPGSHDFTYDAGPAINFLKSAFGYPVMQEDPGRVERQATVRAQIDPAIAQAQETFATELQKMDAELKAVIAPLKAKVAAATTILSQLKGAEKDKATELITADRTRLNKLEAQHAAVQALLNAQGEVQKLAGSDAISNSNATGDDSYDIANERFANYIPALKLALRFLKVQSAKYPADTDLREAVACTRKHLEDVTFIGAYLVKPARFFGAILKGSTGQIDLGGRIRRARAQRMVMFYDGAVNTAALRHLHPADVKAFTESGARLAAIAFQNAFFGLDNGNSQALLNADAVAANEAVEREVERAMTADYGYTGITAGTVSPGLWKKKYTEYQLLVCRLNESEREASIADKAAVDPRPAGRFAAHQLKRARNAAIAEFQTRYPAKIADAFTLANEPDLAAEFRALLTNAVLAESGITPDYEAEPTLKGKLEQSVNERFFKWKENAEVQKHLNGITKMAAAQFEEDVRAVFFGEEYLQSVGFTNDYDQTSPAQPGVLQGMRQNRWVRSKTWLARQTTAALRAIEGMFPRQVHGLGLLNRMSRMVPLFNHIVIDGVSRNLKLFAPYVTGVFVWNMLFWNSKMPYDLFVWNTGWFFALFGARNLIEASLRNVGFKTQDNIKGAVIHAGIYGILTNLVYGPMTLLQPFYQQGLHSCGEQIKAIGELLGL